jgi:hypothetical protein
MLQCWPSGVAYLCFCVCGNHVSSRGHAHCGGNVPEPQQGAFWNLGEGNPLAGCHSLQQVLARSLVYKSIEGVCFPIHSLHPVVSNPVMTDVVCEQASYLLALLLMLGYRAVGAWLETST